MCLAIPGQVVNLPDEHFAVVEVSDVRRKVNVDLLADDPPEPGDWVLIHVGFAMSKIGEKEAREQLELLASFGEAASALEEIEGYRFQDAEQ